MVQMLSAGECLTEFFSDRRRGAVGDRLERIDRVERILRECVEESAALVLTESEQVLLSAERQFEIVGAVARVMPVDGLLLALELHLEHLGRRPSTPEDRRTELDVCAALARHLSRELRHLDIGCAIQRVTIALRARTAELDGAVTRAARRPRRWGLRPV